MAGGVSAVGQQQLTPEQQQRQMQANYQNQLQSFMTSFGSADPGEMLFAPGCTNPYLALYNPFSCAGSFGSPFGQFGMGMFPGGPMGYGGNLYQLLSMKDASDYIVRDDNGKIIGTDKKALRQDMATAGVVSDEAKVLQENLEHSRSSLIYGSFKEFVEAVKNSKAYQEAEDDKARMLVIKEAYKAATGRSLEADIDSTSLNNFWSGFENVLPFVGDKSNTQLKKELLGREEPRSARLQRTGGTVAAGAAAGAAIGAIAGLGAFSWATVGIGAAIGAGWGLIKSCFN